MYSNVLYTMLRKAESCLVNKDHDFCWW